MLAKLTHASSVKLVFPVCNPSEAIRRDSAGPWKRAARPIFPATPCVTVPFVTAVKRFEVESVESPVSPRWKTSRYVGSHTAARLCCEHPMLASPYER